MTFQWDTLPNSHWQHHAENRWAPAEWAGRCSVCAAKLNISFVFMLCLWKFCCLMPEQLPHVHFMYQSCILLCSSPACCLSAISVIFVQFTIILFECVPSSQCSAAPFNVMWSQDFDKRVYIPFTSLGYGRPLTVLTLILWCCAISRSLMHFLGTSYFACK